MIQPVFAAGNVTPPPCGPMSGLATFDIYSALDECLVCFFRAFIEGEVVVSMFVEECFQDRHNGAQLL